MSKTIWDEVSYIMAHTNYKFHLNKGDTAIYCIDVRKVIEKLKKDYIITKKS